MTSRSGSHRIDADALLDQLGAVVGELRLRKCESSGLSPCMARAKAVFTSAMRAAGGATAVAALVPCDESNIRLQSEHPKRSPLLSVIYALPPEQMDDIAADIHAAAAEKRAVRRAG